jgi:hypothetical protein
MYEDDPMVDSLMAEIYDVKERIARECGYDIKRMSERAAATMRRLEAQGFKFRYADPPDPNAKPFPYTYSEYIDMCLEAKKRGEGPLCEVHSDSPAPRATPKAKKRRHAMAA